MRRWCLGKPSLTIRLLTSERGVSRRHGLLRVVSDQKKISHSQRAVATFPLGAKSTCPVFEELVERLVRKVGAFPLKAR
jgi:hypothetical protein